MAENTQLASDDQRLLALTRNSAIWQRWDMLMQQYPESLADQVRLTTQLALGLQIAVEELQAARDILYGKYADAALKLLGEEPIGADALDRIIEKRRGEVFDAIHRAGYHVS